MPAWNEFEAKRGPAAPAAGVADQDFDGLCAQVFTTTAGRELLAALRDRYIELLENPGAPEATLRVRAAQQRLVRDLELARDRGLEAIAAKNKPA
jgi:hypothetical protein